MPSKYKKAELASDGAMIYDAVVASTPALANAGLPFSATAGVRSQDIGDFFYTSVELANTFIHALLNKIALEVVMSKSYVDPWDSLEKGKIDKGEVIEEIYIHMAKPKHYDAERAEREVFKRELPDVKTAFHAINYQHYYKLTIQREELRQAFLSWEAFHKFVADLIDTMYTASHYDTYQTKKYLIARAILNGGLGMVNVPPITNEQTAKDAIAKARGISNLLIEMSPNYNLFRVPNYVDRNDQIIIINAMVEGLIDVNVLAAAFNMDKAEFLQMHRLTTSGFGDLDTERLDLLFAEDKSYRSITDAEKALLNQIPFAIFDRNWFQIYDYLNVVETINNPEGLYINYNFHVWKILGVSPFANAVAFAEVEQKVTAVTVTPSAVTVSKGQNANLTAMVETEGFADQRVTWSSDSSDVLVSDVGNVYVKPDATGGTATITATSMFDSTKSGTATVTIA